MGCIFTEKRTIRSQLLIAFGIAVVGAVAVVMAVAIGLVASLGSSVKDTAQSALELQSQTHANTTAVEVAASIEQRLRLVSDSISMTNCNEAFTTLGAPYLPLQPFPTFIEYNFVSGCVAADTCPSDFAPLTTPTSRLTGTSGSLEHSSLYTFNSITGCGIKTDSAMTNTINLDPVPIQQIINRAAHIDMTLAKQYAMATNTLQLYISVKHQVSTGYVSLHRTFPGVQKILTGPTCLPVSPGQDAPYDAASRPWFINAPVGGIELEGYRETFSQELVINLSTKNILGNDQIVAAALMLLSDLARIVSNVTLGVNGYAALLLNDGTGQVLIYGQNSTLYVDSAARFTYIDDLDPGLTFEPGTVTTYLRPFDNEIYYVASETLFLDKLILLVYARRADTFTTFPVLEDNITQTSNRVTGVIIGICLAVALLLVMPAVLWITGRLTGPLVMINKVCSEVVVISAKEERDYRPALDLLKPVTSNDELSDLVNDFSAVVHKLDLIEQNKSSQPKYPPNPLFGAVQALGLDQQIILTGLTEQEIEQYNARLTNKDRPERLTYESTAAMHPPSPSVNPTGLLGPKRVGSIEMADFKQNLISPSPTASPGASPMALNVTLNPLMPNNAAAAKLSLSDEYMAKPVKVSAPSRANGCCSLKTKLRFPIAGLLLVGLLIAMALSLYLLNNEGLSWMDTTTNLMTGEEYAQLARIAQTKSLFTELFFQKATFDTSVVSLFVTTMLDGGLAYSNYDQLGLNVGYLQSYSMDGNATDHGVAYGMWDNIPVNFSYSGYFTTAAAGCYNQPGGCAQYANTNDTRLSSLMDFKFRALFHARADLDFIQIGYEDEFTRIYPWSDHSTYAARAKCFVDSTACTPCPSTYPANLTMPVYKATCRSWYQLGQEGGDPTKVYFQDPRSSSNGITVSTSSTPLNAGGVQSGQFYGVLILNTLTATLSQSINQVRVLSTGYVYLLAADANTVVLHPRATYCSNVQCAEGFSDDELAAFQLLVGAQLQAGKSGEAVISKGGVQWAVSFDQVNVGTTQYGIVVTVPVSEVLQPTTDAQNRIRAVIQQQLGIYIAVICILALIILLFTYSLSNVVVQPIKSLITVCDRILQDDLSQNVTAKAGSLETKMMIEAFSGMVIALRFGSESYASGDSARAQSVFSDALALYTKLHNERGVGISQNNLGSVYLRQGNLDAANNYYQAAIQQTRATLASTSDSDVQNKQLAVLSARMGNLAVLRTEQKLYEEAEQLLNDALAMDLGAGNLRSMAIKQGSKGQLYLKMHQPAQAAMLFASALSFIRAGRGVEKFDQNELDVAEQFALLNLGDHALHVGKYNEAAVYLTQSMVLHRICDMSALARAVRLLHTVYEKSHDAARMGVLDITCAQLSDRLGERFTPQPASLGKDVIFTLDYSGSMAGGRIARAVQNMLKIFDEHTQPNDGVAFLRFNNRSETVFPMTLKMYAPRDLLARSTSPNGGTAFRDAIGDALIQVPRDGSTRKRWIVALTDGEDNNSRTTYEACRDMLAQAPVSLIVVGVGLEEHLRPSIMELCKVTQGGVFIDVASDSAEQLNAAFSKVADLIGAQQLTIETY